MAEFSQDSNASSASLPVTGYQEQTDPYPNLLGRPSTLFVSRRIPRLAIVFAAVALLALTLRLVFIFAVSKIPNEWDALGYWSTTQEIRNQICHRLLACVPSPPPLQLSLYSGFLKMLVFDHGGLLPIIMAPLMTVLPNKVQTGYVIFAVLDTLVCLMMAHAILRLKGPLWVAAISGTLQAIYIPAITGGAAFLQQPFIRFNLAFALWSYICAITAERRVAAWLSIGIGTAAMAVAGYSSLETRPLMLFVPGCFLIINFINRRTRSKALVQLVCLLTLVAILSTGTFAVGSRLSMPISKVWSHVFLGVSTDGSATGQVTPLSFPYFWPPDNFPALNLHYTESPFQAFLQAPVDFLAASAFSTFSNWRYPDYLYFQKFILSLDQQQVEHVALALAGLVGLAWLLGQSGTRQQTALLIIAVGLAASAIDGMISVETRRVGVLSPYLAIGGACCIWSLTLFWWHRVRWRNWLATLVLFFLAFIVWLTPLALVSRILPIEPVLVHALVVVLRIIITLASCFQLITFWKQTDNSFDRVWPMFFFAGIFALLTLVQFQDTEWRSWSAEIQTKVRQDITNIKLQAHLQPWVIVDVDSPDQAQALAISINDQLVKPDGVPMYQWEAGVPPVWIVYSIVLNNMANFTPTRRLWSAYQIPKNLLSTSKLTIEVQPKHGSITLRGDYEEASSGNYVGPLSDPWITGRSLWRWMWNGDDPRIPASQVLNGVGYISSYFDGSNWIADDLSSTIGKQVGLYRIFVVQAAFGSATNALMMPSPLNTPTTPTCTNIPPDMTSGTDLLLVCEAADRSVNYYSSGRLIGSSSPSAFMQNLKRNELADEINNAAYGRVDVIQITGIMFVANLYTNDGRLIYSSAFIVK